MKMRLTSVDREPFARLTGKISLLAIRLIWAEYLTLPQFRRECPNVFAKYNIETDYNSCCCPNRLRYSLPCRHILIPFV